MVWLLRNWYKSSRHGTSSVNVLRSDLLVGRSSSELDKILSRVLLLSLRLLRSKGIVASLGIHALLATIADRRHASELLAQKRVISRSVSLKLS
jgi:hypothetical protein